MIRPLLFILSVKKQRKQTQELVFHLFTPNKLISRDLICELSKQIWSTVVSQVSNNQVCDLLTDQKVLTNYILLFLAPASSNLNLSLTDFWSGEM